MDIGGRTAFISGGGGGIGEGLAQAFVEKKMRVVIADLDGDRADEVAAKFGSQALGMQLDVRCPDSWAAAKSAAVDHFGGIDVLCNNAGISLACAPIVDVAQADIDRLFQVNVLGVYNGIRTFGPDMIARRKGHIVNTSSFNGLVSHGTMGPYSASKYAVTALTVALREEMAPHGVGVSALYPGATRTPMLAEHLARHAGKGRERNMMDPIWVGRAAVTAIEENRAHIISHPGLKPAYEAWVGSVLDSFGEPAQPGYLD